ncbi:unnamed protein product [Mytilus coruscus]|uniref:Uncharacterized protein n=1 Tax=Mytilus coruscus TaxID=42192 RepID=A0A6J8CTA5_MYTCO|nr:unnamed protein product [Mytilus coruscus]
MPQITDFKNLIPLLDKHSLSDFDIVLNSQMALDIFDYVKSKCINQDKMCQWFTEITKNNIEKKTLVTRLHRLKREVSRKRGLKKATLLTNIFNTCNMCASDSKIQNLKSTEDATYKRIAEDLANELKINQEKKSSELRAYTPEFRQAVMNISGTNVATEHIVSVINESLKLAGKTLNQIPARRTIDNIVTETVVVSNIQVGKCLQDKEKQHYILMKHGSLERHITATL